MTTLRVVEWWLMGGDLDEKLVLNDCQSVVSGNGPSSPLYHGLSDAVEEQLLGSSILHRARYPMFGQCGVGECLETALGS